MTSSIKKHKHHIIPRHAGGTDDPSNIVELTIRQHALAHKKLYKEHGRWQDKVAWLSLSKQITGAEATRLAQSYANKNKTPSQIQACINNFKGVNIGRKHSKEWRLKQSISNKKYWAGRPKPWLIKTYKIDGKIYKGLKEIREAYNCTTAAVYARFKSRHYPGWINE